MKFQRSTFLLVLVATLLMGGFFVSEVILGPKQQQSNGTDPKGEGGQLFNFEESDIVTLVIQRPDLTLTFEKRETPPVGESIWLMKQPEEIPASDGAVAFLLNLVATGSSRQTLDVGSDRKAEFGFDQPAIVNVTLTNGDEHTLVLGLPNFDRSAFYALTDTPPNAETLPIQLVSVDFDPAINRPLDEWKYTAEQPPSTEPSSDENPEGEESPADAPESNPPAAVETDLPEAAAPEEAAPEEAAPESPEPPELPESPDSEDPIESEEPLELEGQPQGETADETDTDDATDPLPPNSDDPNPSPPTPES